MATNFIGEYRSKIDAKNRIVFPAAFKNVLFSTCAEKRLVVQKDFYKNKLLIYPVMEWGIWVAGLKSKLNLQNEQQAEFWYTFMSKRAEVEPDEKSGRLIIPRRLLDEINVSDEVVFLGMDEYIELCNPTVHDSMIMSAAQYAEAAKKYFG
jgi:MraZ protein